MMLDGRTPLYVLVLGILMLSHHNEAQMIDAERFLQIMKDMAETSLGSKYFQETVNERTFNEEQIVGQALVNQLAESIGGRFKTAFDGVTRLRDAFESDYSSDSFEQRLVSRDDRRQCCKTNITGLEESVSFKGKVNIYDFCLRTSSDVSFDEVVPMSNNILDVMNINRLSESSLKWQYFGTEEGVVVNYPAFKDENACESYDPRFRPWYVESATPAPKDIVLVIDHSESMKENNLMELSKEAANTVISTTNPNDRFGVVAFSNGVTLPSTKKTCYTRELAFATPENKKELSDWITNDLDAFGGSKYLEALNKAFDLLQGTNSVLNDPRKRRRVILFVTDGDPSDATPPDYPEILGLLRDRNAALNNSVTVITYGIGEDVGQNAKKLLSNMAYQVTANLSIGPITNGTFIQVASSSKLRTQLGSYYDILSYKNNISPVLTAPYVDWNDIGSVVSVCLPVYSSEVLKGVTCIDISLTEILNDALYLSHGTDAYAFISDYKGRTLIHPLMPDPMIYDNSMYLNIDDIEKDVEVQEILNSMKMNESGSLRVRSSFISARGNTTIDGVTSNKQDAIYYWKPIGNTNFSICVVTTAEDKNISVFDPSHELHAKNFIYHRLDLVDDDKVTKCKSNNRLSTQSHSVVKFMPFAFKNPINYLNQEDRKFFADQYEIFMESQSDIPDNHIKTVTKQMVALSESLETIWKSVTKYDKYIVWRYYMDYFGHLRIFPGNSLPKKYDHTVRAWFVKTVSEPTVPPRLTLSAPYLDAMGAGIVISLSVPILIGRKNGHEAKDPILGAAGMDFRVSYLQNVMNTEFPACQDEDNTCFLVDTSGTLVYHPQIHFDSDKAQEVEGYHITEVEPDIARYLLNNKKLTHGACVDLGYKRTHYTWRLNIDYKISNYDVPERDSPAFDLHRVPNMNVFLGITKRPKTPSHPCLCPDRTKPNFSPVDKCAYREPDSCRCPCYSDAEFQYCHNTFTNRRDRNSPCLPQPESIGFRSPIPGEKEIIASLVTCPNFKCEDRLTLILCNDTVGCTWCQQSEQNASCMDTDSCSPYIPTTVPTTDGPPENGDNLGMIIGVIAAAVVVIAVVVVLVVLHKKDKLCRPIGKLPSPDRYEPYQAPSHLINTRLPGDRLPTPPPPRPPDVVEKVPKRGNSYVVEDPDYLHTSTDDVGIGSHPISTGQF